MRDYRRIALALRDDAAREDRMRFVIDALWDAFHDQGFSWVGFYLPEQTESGVTQLVLGPRRDKPACSPIGLHGVCGQAFLARQTVIVRDVLELGQDYIACDPRDRSEIVVPCFEPTGEVWAVLDVDSFEPGAFDERDAAGLRDVLVRARLTK